MTTNTQQTQTNKQYNTTFTSKQFDKFRALTDKYNATCKGDYESTFVGGVAHAYCDSGIQTDGLSARDIDTLATYFTGETIYSVVGLDTLQTWMQEIAQDDTLVLDCVRFVQAVQRVFTKAQHKQEYALEAALAYCWDNC
tara:strand:+ start:552 stop:971 length:420 start_codon:yes stop_codon:yes gene_type:complete